MDAPQTGSRVFKCGHPHTPENSRIHRVGDREYPRCRECALAYDRARHEPARIATDRAWLAEHGLRLPADSTPEHVAWCVRRLRERLGLELRARDRQQATRQLEDLGAL